MSERLHILIVEDNQADVDLIRESLPQKGPVSFHVESVPRLSEALARLKNAGIDLVLLDLGLPDSQGLETFHKLSEATSHIPVIILTGNDDQEVAVLAVRDGAQDYLVKGQAGGSMLTRAVRYAMERKRADRRQFLSAEILSIINESHALSDAISSILTSIKRETGLEAVGIRLRSGEDFPYFVQNGFSDDFLRTENTLTVHDQDGGICRDENGNISLECTCGLVITGKTDPTNPLFTQGGSFWINDSLPLLDLPADHDPQLHPRNRCIHEGFRSVALIPIHANQEIVGLLQLNDRKIDCFTLDVIHYFEGLGTSIGIALTRKHAEEALIEKTTMLDNILRSAIDMAVATTDLDFRITYYNPMAEKLFGYSAKQVIGKTVQELHTKEKVAPERFVDAIEQVRSKGEYHYFVEQKTDAGIRHLESRVAGIMSQNGDMVGYSLFSRDITNRKRAEEALRERDARLQSILDNSSTVVFLKDLEGRYITVNRRYEELFHVTRQTVVGKSDHDIFPREYADRFRQHDMLALEKGGPFEIEELVPQDDSLHTYISAKFPILGADGKPYAVCGIATDITERKRAEQKLQMQEMQLRTILESTGDGILAVDNAGKVIKTNQRFADLWEIPSDLFKKGSDEDLLTYVLSQLVDPDAFLKKVRELYSSTVVDFDTILFKDGRIIERYSCPLLSEGVINGRVWSFRDITERKKAEESLKETLGSLRRAIGATIQVMASAVEVRDPYTAGHQIRSADLARAIAKEMGLSPEKIEGIRMAGSIHDIGKLSIPAEILSKPTKLSEIEFSLIKEHARQGYEMLKDVESPWPLAEIVRQHHERMDGSGYPRNLKGEEILIEARILTVADVVEAMASYRPYRPGLGINAALNEIEKNRGIFYDNTVADACLRLFREKGFQLAGT